MIETALEEEMTEHLGRTKHEKTKGGVASYSRNGKTSKTVLTDTVGPVEIEVGVTRNSHYPGEGQEDFFRWPEQALTPNEMLQIYTTNVAYENFVDDVIGTIEVSKKADLVVLGENLPTVEPSKISDIPILYIFSNGRLDYTDGSEN